MVAVNHHHPRRIGAEARQGFGEFPQWQPLATGDAADRHFIGLAAIDQARTFGYGQGQPTGDLCRADIQGVGGIGKHEPGYSMITGVPTVTFSKNFSDIGCGMRMQPCDAA